MGIFPGINFRSVIPSETYVAGIYFPGYISEVQFPVKHMLQDILQDIFQKCNSQWKICCRIYCRINFRSVIPSETYVAGAYFPGYISEVKQMLQDILQEFEKCVSQMEADMDSANAPLRQINICICICFCICICICLYICLCLFLYLYLSLYLYLYCWNGQRQDVSQAKKKRKQVF